MSISPRHRGASRHRGRSWRATFAVVAVAALTVVSAAGLAYASDADVAVVDTTVPVASVTLAQGASGAITINLSVTGNQVGTATFKVNRDWVLDGGTFTGSNPETFTVPPRGPSDPATTFSTSGTVKVASTQAAGGPFTLHAGAFDITNSNSTGAKLGAGDSSSYAVTVSESAPPADTTAPSISYTLSPEDPDGSNGWWVSPITVHWTVTDPESTVTSTSGCENSTVSDDTTGVTFTCEATSTGGTNSVTTETIKLDATKPDVSLVDGPADGGIYYFGFVPDAPTCTASDATSGLADDCSVSGYGTTVGDHTVTASATDNAGNSNTDSATYHVNPWTLSGFYAPVDLHGTLNTVKGGSTVPLKFEIFAGDTELTDVDAIASFTTTKVNCDSGASTDAIETLATTGGTSLRYDTTGGQFIQNWKTPTTKGQCYRATVTTDDGSSIPALFQIK